MSEFTYSTAVPQGWDTLCEKYDAFFGSTDWQMLLERSFKCRTIFAIGENSGFAITAFSAGPFRVGYLGFPIGNVIGPAKVSTNLFDGLRDSDFRDKPTCLRVPVSAFGPNPEIDRPAMTNPETVIVRLPDWDLSAVSKRLRRDIRKAERSKLIIHEASNPAIGANLYEMYAETVRRHRGNLRYTATYYHGLVELAGSTDKVRILIAKSDADIAGFVVTVQHGSTTYYLHGGTNKKYLRDSPSDLLLNIAIERAKQDGRDCFSMMSSPPDQQPLVRYKEKWGAETRKMSTYTIPLRPSYALFNALERVYRLFR